MPIRCPKCGIKHDVLEFQGIDKIKCRCGYLLNISLVDTVEDFLRYFENEEERTKAYEIQRDAQNICRLILDENTSEVDIEIAKGKLRDKVSAMFPDKMDTYRMIYEARFTRLWEQFRQSNS